MPVLREADAGVRATLRQALLGHREAWTTGPEPWRETRRERLAGWWMDFPPRLCGRRWWRQLLFEPGQGWLRWGTDGREGWGGWYDPPESYVVAPPARRLWLVLRWRDRSAWRAMVDEDRGRELRG